MNIHARVRSATPPAAIPMIFFPPNALDVPFVVLVVVAVIGVLVVAPKTTESIQRTYHILQSVLTKKLVRMRVT